MNFRKSFDATTDLYGASKNLDAMSEVLKDIHANMGNQQLSQKLTLLEVGRCCCMS